MSSLTKYFCTFLISIVLSLSCFANAYPPLKSSTASYFINTWYYVFWPFNFILPHPIAKKTIYEIQNQYNHIRVYEDDNEVRYLVFLPENGYQSVFDSKNPGLLISDYAKYTFLSLPAFGETPQKVLFVGMGGAIMATYLRKHYSDTQIDLVELDDDIPAIARQYFGFIPDSRTRVFIEDGRKYIDETKEKYDIIFLDVYDAETIPSQFTTQEFFHNVRKCLTEDGVLSVNLANLGEGFVSKIISSVTSEFPDTYIFLSERKTNYILISMINEKMDFSKIAQKAKHLDAQKTFNIGFSEMLRHRVPYSL